MYDIRVYLMPFDLGIILNGQIKVIEVSMDILSYTKCVVKKLYYIHIKEALHDLKTSDMD